MTTGGAHFEDEEKYRDILKTYDASHINVTITEICIAADIEAFEFFKWLAFDRVASAKFNEIKETKISQLRLNNKKIKD